MRTTPSSSIPNKGQSWSLDFTLGMLLFIFGILIAVKLIVNSVQGTEFEAVQAASQSAIDLLAGEGNPPDWTNDTVVRLGITTHNRLNVTKVRSLYALDPNRARKFIGMRYDYYLFFVDKDDGILFMNMTCGYGNADVKPLGGIRYTTVAYYASNALGETDLMDVAALAYNASIFVRNESSGTVINGWVVNGSLDDLVDSIDRYDTLVLQDPSFDLYAGMRNATGVAAALSDWVSKGKILIVVQKAGVLMAGGSFSPTEDGAGNLTVVLEDPDSAFVIGDSLIPDKKFTVSPMPEAANVRLIANYSNGQIGLALWDYGEGRVFYMSDSQGLLGTMTNLTGKLNYTMSRLAVGICPGLDLSEVHGKNVASAERFIIHNNKIAKMDLYVWDGG